jgi:hypothetical protein
LANAASTTSPKLQLTPASSHPLSQKQPQPQTLITCSQSQFQPPNPSLFLTTAQSSTSVGSRNSTGGVIDTRRWSFASIHSNSSSGYTGSGGVNTPPNEKTVINRHKSNIEQQEGVHRNLSAQSSVTDTEGCGGGSHAMRASLTGSNIHPMMMNNAGAHASGGQLPHPNHIIHRLSFCKFLLVHFRQVSFNLG